MEGKITVQCVGCKTKRTDTPEKLCSSIGQPMCPKCSLPCVVVSAHVTSRTARGHAMKCPACRSESVRVFRYRTGSGAVLGHLLRCSDCKHVGPCRKQRRPKAQK